MGVKVVAPRGMPSSDTRGNSTKTGLRSKILALEYESAQCTERAEVWYDYYQPQGPAAFHLANECGLTQACSLTGVIGIGKPRSTSRRRPPVQAGSAARAKGGRAARKVNTNPEAAIAALATFGLGVRWVASCFRELIYEVQNQGSAWVRPEGSSSGVPAGPETAAVVEAAAPRGEGRINGAAGEPVGLTGCAAMAPLSASGREAEDLPYDPEGGLNDSAQVVVNQASDQAVDSGAGSVDGWPPRSGRHVSSYLTHF